MLIAEDEQPLRAALSDLLESEPGLQVAGAAADAGQAIELARETQPDVALLDVRMPAGGGPAAAREIRLCSPRTRVLALSAYEDRTSVVEMLACGAVGYLVKGTPPREIVEAVRRAARGQASLSAHTFGEVVDTLLGSLAERSQGERDLRRDERRFSALLEAAPEALVISDPVGRIVLVNRRTEVLFGYGRDELVGRSVDVLVPERLRGRHRQLRASYVADPSTRPMRAGLDLAGRRRDGSEFAADISLAAADTDDGRLVIAFVREFAGLGPDAPGEVSPAAARSEASLPATAFIRDVSGLERPGHVLLRGEHRYAALLDAAPDGVVVTDRAGRIVLVNAQTERLFGYRRHELLGNPVEQLLPNRLQGHHVSHRSDFIADPTARPMGAGLEFVGRRKDGSEVPVDVSLSTIETDDGMLVTAFVRDLTERRAQIELQRSLAERRAVLAHLVSAGEEERRRIANDIHDDSIQAITAAGMRLQILRRKLDSPELAGFLDDLEATVSLSIERLRHLLFELRPPVLDHEGLQAALEMYLDEVHSRAEQPLRYNVEDRMRSQPPPETRLILYRITQEALTNVRKHARATSTEVLLSERDGGYLVRVSDDGVGFRESDLGPLPGHLGLASIRERAELAGGSMRIESAPSEGTTVEVWIPALEDPAPLPSGAGTR